jgi:hypothetical protein
MILSDPWMLMGAVLGLYLYDAALLLFHNEVVLEVRRRDFVVSGGSALEFGGRHLFLPNPCCPHRVLLRLAWSAAASPPRQRARWQRARLTLVTLAPWTWLLLGLFFVGLPGALWLGTHVVLLGWLLSTYLVIVAMLVQVYRCRKALNLSARAVLALAFDALLCAPFALNIVRKISLRQEAVPDLRRAASSLLSPIQQTVLLGLLRERIRTSLDFVEPGSAASNSLRACLKHFEDSAP